MEITAGARARSGHASVGQRCRYPVHRAPVPLLLARPFQRPLQSAGGPSPSPLGGTPNDANDTLAPIIYRFADGPSPAVSSSNGHMPGPGAKWSNIVSTGGNGGVSAPGLAQPLASGAAGFVEAPARTIPSSSSSGAAPASRPPQDSGVTSPTTTASTTVLDPSTAPGPAHETDVASQTLRRGLGQGPSNPHSYSDYYREQNTSYTRSPPGAVDAVPANGWSAPSPPSSATAHSANGSPAPPATPASSAAAAADSPAPGAAASEADSAEVAAALARAQAALARAETSLDDIQRLSSSLDAAALESLRAAQPPSRWARVLAVGRSVATLAGLSLAMLATHAFGLAVQWVGAAAGAAAIATWGLRRGSLAPSGAAAAFLVGLGTLGSSLRFGATLIGFFLSSSKLTAYKEELKQGLEESSKKGGQRTWVQVFCNGLIPTIIAVVYGILAGCVDLPLGPAVAAAAGPALESWRAAALTALMGGFLGYYACCCGDTWASELGPLSADTPRLITTMRPVRRGTNGGVTLLGLSASIMGGMFVGLVFYLAGLLSPTLWIFESQRAVAAGQWRLIPLGLMAGLFGSALDSLLGATLQYSGYDTARKCIVQRPGPDVVHISGMALLDNNAVNALSASLTSALTAVVALKSFGF